MPAQGRRGGDGEESGEQGWDRAVVCFGEGGYRATLPAAGWGRGLDSRARTGPSLNKARVAPLSLSGPGGEDLPSSSEGGQQLYLAEF